MSLDDEQAKIPAENGGTARKSAASDGRGSVGEPRMSQGEPRGSTGEARGSMGSAGSRGSEARGSDGSVGEKRVSGPGARVSFEEVKEGNARVSKAGEPRASRGSAGGQYPSETRGEQDDYGGQELHVEDWTAEDGSKAYERPISGADDQMDAYPLDEFMRAKTYFQQVSSKSGLSLYDHLSDVIRKFLDERAPNNPVDYLEEVSMNVKRFRFGLKSEDVHDVFNISDGAISDAERIYGYFKAFAKWNGDRQESSGEGETLPGGSFQNLLRLQYYAEQINIGLPREEMYRVALGIKELGSSRSQIGRLRFWGKIFATQKSYYVVEAELKFGGTDQAMDLWNPKDDEGVNENASDNPKGLEMSDVETFGRAKDVVLNHEFLQAYTKTSGLKQASQLPDKQGAYDSWEGEDAPPQKIALEDSGDRADAMKWEGYQQELMQNFPQTKTFEPTQVPAEPDGSGVNRRVFYVCNELGKDWVLLPPVTPQQINASRNIRWFLTGNLDSTVKSIPAFPGREGHYLKTLLVRITAGAMCSPKGYFKPKPSEGELPGEEDDEELEGEDAEHSRPRNDMVQPVKKYTANMKALMNPNLTFWVHHTSYILIQGRNVWWNPAGTKPKRRSGPSEYGSETEGSSEMEDDDEDDEEIEIPGKEVSPPLFRSISLDKSGDGNEPWSIMNSSAVFPEFQVVSVRSNVWPGSFAICTSKGKVSNLYFGDGLKFSPISYCPPLSDAPTKEYKWGPELEETHDASVEQEQSWLNKLALKEMEEGIDVGLNEEAITTGEDDDEYEY